MWFFRKSYTPEEKLLREKVATELRRECWRAGKTHVNLADYIKTLKKEISAPNQ